MVQETGYPIKILSNFLTSGVMLSAPHEVAKLDPKFITGLTDAEGSFSIKISKIGENTFVWVYIFEIKSY